MNSQAKQAKDIFIQLVGKVRPEEWEKHLMATCSDDEEVQHRVRALLRAHVEPGSFLEGPVIPADATVGAGSLAVEEPGTVIGHYKLLEQIGEGGMGTVYMAEQTEPVHRQVALKVIKPGMDTKHVIARFETERQALALMAHPNIARVLDAGTSQSGRPFFVMELVEGTPIHKFCDEHQLKPRQRLALFIEVCHAVQHAHQKGIIHRDLKPSNILVAMYDDKPVPKVIDFGVAKATGEQLTGETKITLLGQVLGTLEYMSPEQTKLNPLHVDTRSDIYSLGAVLYELLSGSSPFGNEKIKIVALDETLRMIQEEEPTKPSTKVSNAANLAKIASDRRTQPDKLSALIRGDLDWIVMKALEKDRTRRYETANGFAQDIVRFLNNEPVLARPSSAIYKFQKFARRNRGVLVTGLIIGAILVVGSGFSIWQAVRATNASNEKSIALVEKSKAIEEKDKALIDVRFSKNRTEILGSFILKEIVQSAKPGVGRDPNISVRQALLLAEKKIATEFSDDEEMEAWVRHQIGLYFHSIGEVRAALANLRQAYDMRRELFGLKNENTINSAWRLADVLIDLGNPKQALDLKRKILQSTFNLYGNESNEAAEALHSLGVVLNDVKEFSESKRVLKKAIELSKTLDNDEILAQAYNELGNTAEAEDQIELAETLYNSALKAEKNEMNKLIPMSNLARLLSQQGKLNQARIMQERIINKQIKVYRSEDHRRVIYSKRNLAITFSRQEEYKKSAELFRECLDVKLNRYGEDHPNTLDAATDLTIVLLKLNEYEEVARLMKATIAAREKILSKRPEHLDNIDSLGQDYNALGNVKLNQSEYTEAVQMYSRGISVLNKFADDARFFNKNIRCYLYSNRALANRYLENFDDSLSDAAVALSLASSDVFKAKINLCMCKTMAQKGDYLDACRKTAEVLDGIADKNELAFHAAGVWALAARTANADQKISAKQRDKIVKEYVDQSLLMLKLAKDLGYFDQASSVRDLKNEQMEPDFSFVRRDERFGAFISSLEKNFLKLQK